jgi:hypothetical protein
MRRFTIPLLLASVLVAPAFAAGDKPLTIKIDAQNNSGQSGTATLTPEGDSTKVVVETMNAPAGVPQPAHIHLGTCANLDKAPKWKLEALKDGKSTTVVPASLATIMKEKSAINVHKSAGEIAVYVACGDIVQAK